MIQKRILFGSAFVVAISAIGFTLHAHASYLEFPEITPTPVATSTPAPTAAPGAVLPPPAGSSPSPSVSSSPSGTPLAVATPSVGVTPFVFPDSSIEPMAPRASPLIIPSYPPGANPTAYTLVGTTTGNTVASTSFFVVMISLVTSGLMTALALFTAWRTGVDIAHLFGFMTQSLWEVIGLKRRVRVWGVIYDAHTKRGIPHARVELRNAENRVLETRYADQDGRYGFLAQSGGTRAQTLQVRIIPTVVGYGFPSRTVAAAVVDYLVYDHIYAGDLLTISGDAFVRADIPLDPSRAMRKQFVSTALWLAPGRLVSSTLDVMFWVGLVAAPIVTYLQPTPLHITIFVLFVVVNAFRMLARFYRPFGLVRDHANERAVPYALVTLNELNGTRIAFCVSDASGRYVVSTRPGSYAVRVTTPAQVAPQRTTETAVRLRTGWMTDTVHI